MHALGTRHSFTDLPDTTGTLIDLAGLEPGFALHADEGYATIGAGTRYGELALLLDEQGWALHNLGSLPHIAVGGATATGTHGSGDGNGVLTTAVRAFRYVGADGDLHEVRRGDADFAALVVGVGAFGVIVSLDLDIQPSYRLRQDVYEGITWDAALADLDAITGAGYSVSVFTRWDDDSIGYVWVKTRLDQDHDPVPDELLDGGRVARRRLAAGRGRQHHRARGCARTVDAAAAALPARLAAVLRRGDPDRVLRLARARGGRPRRRARARRRASSRTSS